MAKTKQLLTRPSKQSNTTHTEFLKLRIYGTITLMAANVGLLLQGDTEVRQAVIVILATTFGLWSAGLMSEFIAHRIVHEKATPQTTVLHELNTHRGILLAALPSLITLTLAGLDIIEAQTALIANIALAFTSLTITTARAAKSDTDNKYIVAGLSAIAQIIVALLIVTAKFSAK